MLNCNGKSSFLQVGLDSERCPSVTRSLGLLLVFSVLTGCSAPTVEDRGDDEIGFRAVGCYVTETNHFWDINKYINAMFDGSFEYDDVVRQPPKKDRVDGVLTLSVTHDNRLV